MKTEKEVICRTKSEFKSRSCHASDLLLETKLQKFIFLAKYGRFFLPENVPFSNPCYDGNMHTYATTKVRR